MTQAERNELAEAFFQKALIDAEEALDVALKSPTDECLNKLHRARVTLHESRALCLIVRGEDRL